MIAEFCGTLLAAVYGGCTAFRKKTPLFYKIIFFAMLTCLMGNLYTILYGLLWQASDDGFHVGYLGYIGMFFFLYSSYYGAINSLADGKQPEFRRYRIAAGMAASAFFIASAALVWYLDQGLWMILLLVPMGLTVYFAAKLLVIPDVEMGIIRVMRTYNALVLGLCISMMIRILSVPGSTPETISSLLTGILLAACLPVARNGVKKWFIS